MRFKEIIFILLLIAFIITFFSFYFGGLFVGGCFVKPIITDVDNPNNLNLSLKHGECHPYFLIKNYENEIIFYEIKGDIEKDENISYGTKCMFDEYVRDHGNLRCAHQKLEFNKSYPVYNVHNDFEIFTDKGNIKARIEYNDSRKLILKIGYIALIITILLGLIYYLLAKKRIEKTQKKSRNKIIKNTDKSNKKIKRK